MQDGPWWNSQKELATDRASCYIAGAGDPHTSITTPTDMVLSSQTLRHALRLFAENPLMAFRKAAVRLLPDPSGTRILKLNGVAFPCDFAFDPAIKEMYFGTYEQQIVGLLHEFLEDGALFLDVGANIGYLTAVASGLVGPGGAVHSFEPVPRYVERLRMLQTLNPDRTFLINQFALGDQAGTARIDVTNLPNIGWNTMVPNYMPAETRSATVEVPVRRLDDYLLEHKVTAIGLIKIDTEGYELPVLRGMTAYLQNTGYRPPIICEVAPAAYPLLGTSLTELETLMTGFGYGSYSADRHRSPLPLTSVQDTTNVLFQCQEDSNGMKAYTYANGTKPERWLNLASPKYPPGESRIR